VPARLAGTAAAPGGPVEVIVIGVFAENQPQVPLAGDHHPVQALAAGAAHLAGFQKRA
jgi:hypothetical protein